MNNQYTIAASRSQTSTLVTNKVIRNTYMLLSMTLFFSALTAGVSMALNLPHPGLLLTLGGYFGLLFLTAKYRDGALGLAFVFALTGLTTRKDFSFMGGFLMVGILVAFMAGLGAMFFEMPGLSLAVSSMFVLLMAGLILYETSNIIHGGETNYIMATVTLFVAIFNLFTSLLHLLGHMNGNE